MRVLVESSSFDLPTSYISTIADQLASEAQAMGHEVRVLRDYEATPDNLAYLIQSFQPELCFFSGHGGPGLFTSMNLTPLLVACTNDGILAGSGTFLISCLTGQELVPSIVKKGGLAAAGFTSEYTWVVSPPYEPSTDPYWAPFKRMLIESSRELLRGGGFGAWYSTLKRVGIEEASRWGQSTDPQAPDIVYALRHDYGAATYMGAGGGASAGGESVGLLALIPLAALLLG
jgi:hypothetical protein